MFDFEWFAFMVSCYVVVDLVSLLLFAFGYYSLMCLLCGFAFDLNAWLCLFIDESVGLWCLLYGVWFWGWFVLYLCVGILLFAVVWLIRVWYCCSVFAVVYWLIDCGLGLLVFNSVALSLCCLC